MTSKELRRLRDRAGLSQASLAKLAGVSVRTVIRWEMGDVPIPQLEALGLNTLFDKIKTREK